MRTWLAVLLFGALGADAGLAADFEFVVIGDTRPRFESENFREFEALIARINPLKPAFVINLGDLIYGYGPRSKEKQWDKYQQAAKAISVPYYQVPGNHDTHSREARRIYGRRFGKFYQSFDYAGSHLVLLDNSEEGRWGYLGPRELEWLETDLQQTKAESVFVFLHFPVWEPERVTPKYYEFWAKTLHPLFKSSNVRAVFAGHYHSYGPTREFDGIRYFITGGGGAELRPEYKRSGGEHHFLKVRVSAGTFDVRVITGHRELTDPEADVLGGLQFAARNVSRIGIQRGTQDLQAGVKFSVSLNNPYPELLSGRADWIADTSAFSVEPQTVSLQVVAGGTEYHTFTLKTLTNTAVLPSLPRLEFNVVSGVHRYRFHREVRLIEAIGAPYRATPPVLDGQLGDWDGLPSLKLGGASAESLELRSCHDRDNLYLAVTLPSVGGSHEEELGLSDDLQIGLARRLNDTDFGGDFLRLGFNCSSSEARNRTAGHMVDAAFAGIRNACRSNSGRTNHEICVPLRSLRGFKLGAERRLILDLSFPVSNGGAEAPEPDKPSPNTFSYRVRYGNDSLVPVYFVELTFEPAR